MLSPLSPLSTGRRPRFSAWRELGLGCQCPSCGRARPSGNGETLPGTAPRKAAEVFGRKPIEARSGQPEGRSARRRRKPKPNPLSFEGPAEPEAPGRKVSRKDTEEASLPRTSDREPEFEAARPRRKEPARDPKPAARLGAEPAGTGTGIAIFLRRNLRDRPGPQGLGRNLPGKGGLAFGQDQRT